jgi:NhaP-type Na+/H+ or K+/H+ antiporter
LGAEVALTFQAGLLGKEILYIILLIFFARPVFTLVAFFKEGRSLSDLLLISLTGPRGSATAAMAAIPLTYALKENLPGFVPEAELILITAFLVVLSTMVVGTLAGSIYSAAHPSEEKKKEEKPTTEEEQDIIEELLEK